MRGSTTGQRQELLLVPRQHRLGCGGQHGQGKVRTDGQRWSVERIPCGFPTMRCRRATVPGWFRDGRGGRERGGALTCQWRVGGERRRSDVASCHWSARRVQRTCPTRMDMSSGAVEKGLGFICDLDGEAHIYR